MPLARISLRMPIISFALTLGLVSSAFAQSSNTYTEYSAKFLCGTASLNVNVQESIAPGEYSTSINVHNPNLFSDESALSFLKKAVIAKSEGVTPVAPSSFRQDSLANDYAETIHCGTIRSMLGSAAPAAPAFFEGFVVIVVPPASTPNQLDVTAVYSSSNNGPLTLHVLPIAARVIVPPAAGAAGALQGKIE